MAWQTYPQIPWPIGGQSVAAAASVTSDAIVGSAVTVGRGLLAWVLTVASYVGGSAFDLINLRLQANTRAATTTWADIGDITFGDATAIGEARTSASAIVLYAHNEADYQVRLYSYVQGSAVSAVVTCDIYPMQGLRGN